MPHLLMPCMRLWTPEEWVGKGVLGLLHGETARAHVVLLAVMAKRCYFVAHACGA